MKKNSNVNNSIASKISLKFLVEIINSYILINLVIVTMACGYLYFDAKKDVDVFLNTYEISQNTYNQNMLSSMGYEIHNSSDKLFLISSHYENRFFSWVENIEYNFMVKEESGEFVYISKSMEEEMKLLVKAMGIILIIQGFSVLADFGRNRRMIRETMKPLDELARATTVINKASDMSPESLKKIAGALDSINAAHLETRLPVSAAKDELKSLTVAINGMLDRLDKSYKSQARFVSDASHELRTPIAVIQSYASLLDRWGMNEPETAEEAIKAIKSESESMKIMVEQLLFLARGDNDSMHFQLTTINLGALAEQTLTEIKMIDKTHNFHFENGEDVFVQGDTGLIKQLMRILIDNSIKYTPISGNIYIKVYNDGGKSIFRVQDEGQGIGAQQVENIFDRFYRTDESRNRNTGGSGLGLSIGRWIVEKHNGSITVLSREGVGTRINVEFPSFKGEIVKSE